MHSSTSVQPVFRWARASFIALIVCTIEQQAKIQCKDLPLWELGRNFHYQPNCQPMKFCLRVSICRHAHNSIKCWQDGSGNFTMARELSWSWPVCKMQIWLTFTRCHRQSASIQNLIVPAKRVTRETVRMIFLWWASQPRLVPANRVWTTSWSAIPLAWQRKTMTFQKIRPGIHSPALWRSGHTGSADGGDVKLFASGTILLGGWQPFFVGVCIDNIFFIFSALISSLRVAAARI